MLILASASPRRRELLAQAGYSFEIVASSVAEDPLPGEDGIRLATRLAREKAEAVFELRRGGCTPEEPLLVLGADTVVVCDGELLGKPLDDADAARMLRLLSGRTHQVITGVALLAAWAGHFMVDVAAELTHVTMHTLSDPEVAAYIASGEPVDKAGSYAIQGYASRWIPRVRGCYFNVVGLPLALVSDLLEGVQSRIAGSEPGDSEQISMPDGEQTG
ncbi:MAG TPA: Maf family protein [Acidobacteriaceae bacterium]|nr:Maf family protein [Acidobacteriaceae bacterium]